MIKKNDVIVSLYNGKTAWDISLAYLIGQPQINLQDEVSRLKEWVLSCFDEATALRSRLVDDVLAVRLRHEITYILNLYFNRSGDYNRLLEESDKNIVRTALSAIETKDLDTLLQDCAPEGTFMRMLLPDDFLTGIKRDYNIDGHISRDLVGECSAEFIRKMIQNPQQAQQEKKLNDYLLAVLSVQNLIARTADQRDPQSNYNFKKEGIEKLYELVMTVAKNGSDNYRITYDRHIDGICQDDKVPDAIKKDPSVPNETIYNVLCALEGSKGLTRDAYALQFLEIVFPQNIAGQNKPIIFSCNESIETYVGLYFFLTEEGKFGCKYGPAEKILTMVEQ